MNWEKRPNQSMIWNHPIETTTPRRLTSPLKREIIAIGNTSSNQPSEYFSGDSRTAVSLPGRKLIKRWPSGSKIPKTTFPDLSHLSRGSLDHFFLWSENFPYKLLTDNQKSGINSPVEVGSGNPMIYNGFFSTIPGGDLWDFWLPSTE